MKPLKESVRVERSRDTPKAGATPRGISTYGIRRKFILSARRAVEGLDANGIGNGTEEVKARLEA